MRSGIMIDLRASVNAISIGARNSQPSDAPMRAAENR